MDSAIVAPPLRFLGHGAAIAEALKWNSTFDENAINACRTVGGIYIVAHCVIAAINTGGMPDMLLAALDMAIFDIIASAAIPYFLVVHITKFSRDIIGDISDLPRIVYEWGPVVIGLLVIFATYSFVDQFVDDILDQTVRPILKDVA